MHAVRNNEKFPGIYTKQVGIMYLIHKNTKVGISEITSIKFANRL